jgi:hypothetical protein
MITGHVSKEADKAKSDLGRKIKGTHKRTLLGEA